MGYLLLVPFIYAGLTLLILMAYFRKEYTVPDRSRCSGCSLRSVCARLGLNELLPPSRVHRRPSKAFIIACILALVGYVVVAAACLYLHGFSVPLSYYSSLVGWGISSSFVAYVLIRSGRAHTEASA